MFADSIMTPYILNIFSYLTRYFRRKCMCWCGVGGGLRGACFKRRFIWRSSWRQTPRS